MLRFIKTPGLLRTTNMWSSALNLQGSDWMKNYRMQPKCLHHTHSFAPSTHVNSRTRSDNLSPPPVPNKGKLHCNYHNHTRREMRRAVLLIRFSATCSKTNATNFNKSHLCDRFEYSPRNLHAADSNKCICDEFQLQEY